MQLQRQGCHFRVNLVPVDIQYNYTIVNEKISFIVWLLSAGGQDASCRPADSSHTIKLIKAWQERWAYINCPIGIDVLCWSRKKKSGKGKFVTLG